MCPPYGFNKGSIVKHASFSRPQRQAPPLISSTTFVFKTSVCVCVCVSGTVADWLCCVGAYSIRRKCRKQWFALSTNASLLKSPLFSNLHLLTKSRFYTYNYTHFTSCPIEQAIRANTSCFDKYPIYFRAVYLILLCFCFKIHCLDYFALWRSTMSSFLSRESVMDLKSS